MIIKVTFGSTNSHQALPHCLSRALQNYRMKDMQHKSPGIFAAPLTQTEVPIMVKDTGLTPPPIHIFSLHPTIPCWMLLFLITLKKKAFRYEFDPQEQCNVMMPKWQVIILIY